MTTSKVKPAVAIDSMILVWGVRRSGDPDRLRHARWLFEELQKRDARLIVSAIVVAEYLSHVADADRRATATEIRNQFTVAPFDIRATELASQLFAHGQSGRRKGEAGGRKTLRADTLIIASSKIAGATEFVSSDKACRQLATVAGMEARDLPTIAPDLFSQ